MSPRTRDYYTDKKRLSKSLGVSESATHGAASERTSKAVKKGAYMTKPGGKIKNVKNAPGIKKKKKAAKKKGK